MLALEIALSAAKGPILAHLAPILKPEHPTR
jgi:hypothetical protein